MSCCVSDIKKTETETNENTTQAQEATDGSRTGNLRLHWIRISDSRGFCQETQEEFWSNDYHRVTLDSFLRPRMLKKELLSHGGSYKLTPMAARTWGCRYTMATGGRTLLRTQRVRRGLPCPVVTTNGQVQLQPARIKHLQALIPWGRSGSLYQENASTETAAESEENLEWVVQDGKKENDSSANPPAVSVMQRLWPATTRKAL